MSPNNFRNQHFQNGGNHGQVSAAILKMLISWITRLFDNGVQNQDLSFIIHGNVSIFIHGNVQIDIHGNVPIDIYGNVPIDIYGNVTIWARVPLVPLGDLGLGPISPIG